MSQYLAVGTTVVSLSLNAYQYWENKTKSLTLKRQHEDKNQDTKAAKRQKIDYENEISNLNKQIQGEEHKFRESKANHAARIQEEKQKLVDCKANHAARLREEKQKLVDCKVDNAVRVQEEEQKLKDFKASHAAERKEYLIMKGQVESLKQQNEVIMEVNTRLDTTIKAVFREREVRKSTPSKNCIFAQNQKAGK